MKLLLHYLKFDFLRWRWIVVALWGLVLLHTAAFLVAELLEKPEDASWQLSNKAHLWGEPERVLAYITGWLAGAAVVWAAMLTVLAGAADSPVRGRTWLLTRAGSRRVRVAARLTFVFLTIVLPLVLGYSAMPAISGFDGGTVRLSFGLALKMLVPAVLALWLWVRVWPHPLGLVLGVCMTLSLWGVTLFFELHWPVEWDAIRPSWVVLLVCLTLPALVCLRAAGKQPRDAAVYAWGAGALLPLMLVTAKAASHGLRTAFPGPLERKVFAEAGEEWTLEPTADSQPKQERYRSVGVPFPYLEWSGSSDPLTPSIVEVNILAASWQRVGTQEWSAWRRATGKILPDKDQEGLSLSSFVFDREDLAGEEHLSFRLRVIASLLEKEIAATTDEAEFSTRGAGWTYERRMRNLTPGPVVIERGGVAPGSGVDWLNVRRTRESSSGFSPVFQPVRGGLKRGFPFSNRHWQYDHLFGARTAADVERIAAAPTTMIVFRREDCVRTLRLTSVHLSFEEPPAEVKPQPRDPQPAPVKPATEPFNGREGTRVWPPRSSLTIPAVTAERHEVMYFIHWLKTQHQSRPDGNVAPLVQAYAPQFMEIAALDRLAKGSSLLQALTDGLVEEQRDALLALVPNAPWLVEVVEKRDWQAEARPFVLEAVRRARKIEPALAALCRSYRDPAFHEWMRKDFTFDLPTVLYWESMPDLAAELPAHLDQQSRDWYRLSEEGHEILLQRGNLSYLRKLLTAVNSRYGGHPMAAQRLEKMVLDTDGNPPPSAGIVLKAGGGVDQTKTHKLAPEFRRWFEGLTEKNFRFDPEKHRFVRQSSNPTPP
jgi:hypothetical protein